MGIANKYRFGEAIPMSRADFAAGTIGLADYDQLTETEQDKCLKRDFIWKAPNVKKLRTEGANMDLVYWQNEIRKGFRTKPVQRSADQDYKRIFVEHVSTIRDLVMASTMPGQIEIDGQQVSLHQWLSDNYLTGYYMTQDAGVSMTGALFVNWTPEKIHQHVVRERFGYTPEEALEAEINDRIQGYVYGGMCPDVSNQLDPRLIYDDNSAWHNKTDRKSYVVGCYAGRSFYYMSGKMAQSVVPGKAMILDTRAHSILSVVDAEYLEKAIEDTRSIYRNATQVAATQKTSKRKTKFIPTELADVKQIGGAAPEFDTQGSLTTDKYLADFGFRGGEWGNWLNENERTQNLNMSYIAFKNLANCLGIKYSDVSLKGLSIAFGSRGRSSASAHFEPGNNVINLTKMKGAGCLAHEWGHALDYFIARKYEVPAELATEARSVFRKNDGFVRIKDILPAEFFNVVSAIRNADQFQKDSKKFDELFSKSGHGYWSSECEMWARAFDCYVSDKLKEHSVIDTYLSRGANSYRYKDGEQVYYAYPRDDERKEINAAFDLLMTRLFTLNL